MSSLEGRLALVTGAGRGIGAAIARRLQSAGAGLVLVDLGADSLAKTAADLGGEPRVSSLAADVRDAERIGAWLDERGLVPDILVNNAAIAPPCPALDLNPDLLSEVMSVNFEAPVHLARAVARRLIDAGRPGSIVHVASVNAYRGIPEMLAYNASKAALLGASRTMAVEWAPHHIRVNAVCPGTTRTEIWDEGNFTDEQRQEFASKNAMKRVADPDEIAAAVLFLASEDASFVTAAELVVDAGLTVVV
jgi:NAD(P)-dependent dehydrogenase (short-subunit alcohol dehydrogenase family)